MRLPDNAAGMYLARPTIVALERALRTLAEHPEWTRGERDDAIRHLAELLDHAQPIFRCASGTCPGYPFPASVIAHPSATCRGERGH